MRSFANCNATSFSSFFNMVYLILAHRKTIQLIVSYSTGREKANQKQT